MIIRIDQQLPGLQHHPNQALSLITMKTTTAMATLAGIMSTAQAQYLSLTSVRSDSPIHFLPVNAANSSLHLGGISTHYCPQPEQQAGVCPNTVRHELRRRDLAISEWVPSLQEASR